MSWRVGVAVGAVLALCCVFGNARGLAVMSVDLGSEWMKIGIVSPGVPMEIVLNKESKRKTPVAISFRDGERLIGEDALNVGVKFPALCYSYFMDLLGKKIDNPVVKLFQQRFPHYNLVPDEARGTVLFKYDENTFYSPEELLGMLLSKARDFAQDFSRQPVKEAVITVPPYFNQAERRAVLNAAELVGIKVLQLINTNTAAALNYGIFRRKDFNETAQYIVLYDMGASSTVATVLSYQVAKTKERGLVETNPQVSVLGVGYDRTLGGLEMQIRLRDHLAKAFNNMKKTSTDVFTNHRSMAKLFKEAGRVKNVLSANADHYAQVEGLLEEKDFRVQITREEFEKLNEDLFERVKTPVETALDAAGITMDVVDQVILVGAGTRVPKVQEKLSQYVKRELGKSLNTDEAPAMGAVYKGADLSTGFKVKKFITKDAVIFPIQVDFEREAESDDGSSKTLKIVRRTLFSYMNPYPQKKILTFNKHIDDFNFYVSYGDLRIPEAEKKAFGSLNVTKVELKGVAEALAKHGNEGEPKGVKAHFNMDESGILSLTLVEAVFEKNSTESSEGTVQDTLSKLGSAFSNLFSGTTEEPATEKSDGEGSEGEEAGQEQEKKPSSDTAGNQESELPPNSSTEQEPMQGNKTDEEKKTGETNEASKTNATGSTETGGDKKLKPVLVKEPLLSSVNVLDVSLLDGDKFRTSLEKLQNLNEQDRLRVLREKARNALETFVIDMQNNIYTDEYEKAVGAEEKEKITQACSEISDWLYEDGSDADKSAYEEKLKGLKLLTKDLLDRVREHKDRPDALEALEKMVNISMGFLESSKIMSPDEQLFSETELTTLEKLVTETVTWREKKLKEQESIALSDPPILTVRSIAEKIDALDREVKYMVNKARVNKLNKDKEKAKKASEAENKTDDTPKEGQGSGTEETEKKSDSVPPPQDKDSGSPEDFSEEKKVKIEEESSSPENSESVNPSKPTTTEAEDTHTEL